MEKLALETASPSLPFEHAIWSAFQPIVRLGDRVADPIAMEALARGPRGSQFAHPRAMFEAARQRGVVGHLDRVCIATALSAAVDAPRNLDIFLNVHPQTLHYDPGFPAFLIGTAMRHEIEPARLTLEVLEHARLEQVRDGRVLDALDLVRALGVRVAVDDVAGAVDALRASELRPDFIKLDAALLRDARYSLWTRDVLHTVVADAAVCGAEVIAEGVESEYDLVLAEEAGISLMQGFLLGAPQAATAFAKYERIDDAYRAVV